MFEHDKKKEGTRRGEGPRQGSQVKGTLDGNEEFAEPAVPSTTRGQ